MNHLAGYRLGRGTNRAKRVGDLVQLRALWWTALWPPTAGDLLETSTGRRYLIAGVTCPVASRGSRYTMRCCVLPAGYVPPPTAKTFRWSWARRTRTAPKSFNRSTTLGGSK